MPGTKIEQFGGMLPAWDDHLLPPGQAAASLNGYLFSGALTGWRQPKLLRALTNSAAKFVYRVPNVVKEVAHASLLFLFAAVEGDTVTLGEDTYKFTAAVANPFDVLLTGTTVGDATNFFAALTTDNGLNTGSGVTYGVGTTANDDVSQVAGALTLDTGPPSYVTVVSPDFGAAFNATVVGDSTAQVRLAWVSDPTDATSFTSTFVGGANQTFDSSIDGAAVWLEFLDPDTNVVRSPVVDDSFDRYYFVSPSVAPHYNTHDRITAGSPPWLLGVPPPGCAPSVAVEGGGDLATLGIVTSPFIAGTNVAVGSNSIMLQPIYPTGAMVLNDVTFIPNTTNLNAHFAAVLYEDHNGVPSTLLNTGTVETGYTQSVNAVSDFVNPTGLLANTQYWIGIMTDTAVNIQSGDSSTEALFFVNTFTNGPPPSVGTGAAHANIQMWADLTTESVLEARAYLYTWVTEYDEEGPPSPPTLVNGWSNGTWTIGTFSPPTDDLGIDRNIKTIRVYRTISATGGATVFYWVCDIGIATNTITAVTMATGVQPGSVVINGPLAIKDTLGDDVVALNYQMPSTNWFPPPVNLQGVLTMPNGVLAGFKDNELWFCEPYRPHAWPPGYVITTEFPIVGIGVVGQSVVAATSSTPYVASGVNSSVMTLAKVLIPEPCISRGSVLSTASGVFYMSPNGLILVDQTGQGSNVTELWITRERWRALTPQKNTRAILLASCYFCYGTTNGADVDVAQQGFTIELDQDNMSFTIWPQPGGHRLGFNQMAGPNGFDIDNVEVDPWTGIGLLVQNGGVWYFDFVDAAPAMMPFKWRSKIYQQKTKQNFAAMKVYFTVPTNTPTQSAGRNTAPTLDPSWNTLGPNQYGIVRVFADGKLVTTREIRSSGELLRILSGFKYEQWQFEFEGRVLISNVQIAPSVHELGSV